MSPSHKALMARILKLHREQGASPVRLLQSIQDAFGYLPESAVREAAQALAIPLSRLFAVASFYSAFSFVAPGKHTVCVCEGTACHVKGAAGLTAAIARDLGLNNGERTSADRLFTLKTVRCLGCCSMAPVVRIDDQTYGSMTQNRSAALLQQHRKDARK